MFSASAMKPGSSAETAIDVSDDERTEPEDMQDFSSDQKEKQEFTDVDARTDVESKDNTAVSTGAASKDNRGSVRNKKNKAKKRTHLSSSGGDSGVLDAKRQRKKIPRSDTEHRGRRQGRMTEPYTEDTRGGGSTFASGNPSFWG